jgi:hypothetical protein
MVRCKSIAGKLDEFYDICRQTEQAHGAQGLLDAVKVTFFNEM